MLETEKGSDGGTPRLSHARLRELGKARVDDLEGLVEKVWNGLLRVGEGSVEKILKESQLFASHLDAGYTDSLRESFDHTIRRRVYRHDHFD